MFELNDIVCFRENHKWVGCIGFVNEIKKVKDKINHIRFDEEKHYTEKEYYLAIEELNEKTVDLLNLIQKREEEIETQSKQIAMMSQRHFNDNEKLKKKDKMIDEMSAVIGASEIKIPKIQEEFKKAYCEYASSEEDCCWKTNVKCKDCVKQYFENKVEEEKSNE